MENESLGDILQVALNERTLFRVTHTYVDSYGDKREPVHNLYSSEILSLMRNLKRGETLSVRTIPAWDTIANKLSCEKQLALWLIIQDKRKITAIKLLREMWEDRNPSTLSLKEAKEAIDELETLPRPML